MKKGVRRLIAFVIVIAVLATGILVAYNHKSLPANAEEYTGNNPYISNRGECLVSAHRSGGTLEPEESFMAFKNCVESDEFKTDIFEFDLHITSDGVLVLLHDDTLDRTSNSVEVFGEEKVYARDKTYEQLRQLNMGAKFVDENGKMPYADLTEIPDELKILRVDDILDYLQANGDFRYIIEIKDGGEDGFRGVDALYEILSERGLVEKTVFGTFHGEVSKYVDEKHPDMLRSAGIKEVLKFYFASLFNVKGLEFEYDALQIPYKMVGFNLGTTRVINYAHRHDLAVQYWTINDAKDIEYLNSIGADCIMSDDPSLAYDVINS